MSDFLLELRCEEIPARMQAGARRDLERLFREQMNAAGVALGEVTVWSTPRRLALIARDLPDATEAVSEEVKGPRTSAPAQALEGFLRKTGLTQDQLIERGGVWFGLMSSPGRETGQVLAEAIPVIVRAFPWPKSMRWGARSLSTESLRWVRPLSGIVAILGEALVPVEVGDVRSGYATLGHRFHHPGAITIGGACDYQEKLRACHVIVDHAEREALIREQARSAARQAGLALVEDEGLVVENAGLTEWPAPLLGRFDEGFLEVPPEVIQLTARTNQKYFICRDAAGKLANAFVCTANIAAGDGGAAIVHGNRKVLAARLSDAQHFWEQDQWHHDAATRQRTERKMLAQHAAKLDAIVFHEKLGTLGDKVERVARLARWLAEEGIVPGADPGQAELAARLAKADLVTEMVGEFPELQGLMGGYYARAEGLPDSVADAIRDHYKPVGQGDAVPSAPVTIAVSLADKLDTLAQFFVEGMIPSGSKDPFALRRQALAVISVIQANGLRLPLGKVAALEMSKGVAQRAGYALADREQAAVTTLHELGLSGEGQAALRSFRRDQTLAAFDQSVQRAVAGTYTLVEFFAERLKVQQREAGVRHDLIDAVFALGGEDDLVRLLARVSALQGFVATEDGRNLLAGYKRAANILKKESWEGSGGGEARIPRTGEEDPLAVVDDPDLAEVVAARLELDRRLSYAPEPGEQALIDAVANAEIRARDAVVSEDFIGAMSALATLRAPIDSFFEHVTVNDADPAKRAARLDLLARFRSAVHEVADFSRIEG